LKSLIIKQQFQLEKEGPVSHRNLSWKELLAHLGHYNQCMKLDAVNSLKEMILQNEEFIKLEFSNLLENLCPLFYDRDYKVREAAQTLFKTLIQLPYFSLNQNILKPFFYLINVHLSCAMTNITENVQYSSLKLLDILIESMPEFIHTHAYNIFENFIDQISKSNLKGDKRTLKNDPYKFTSTQAWRHNVLNRLYKILLIISQNKNKSKVASDQELNNSIRVDTIKFDSVNQCQVTTFEDNEFDNGPKSLKIS
jgi:pre-rRNA-processing protein IPI1